MGTSMAYSLLLLLLFFNSYSCTNVESQEEQGGGGEEEKVVIGPLAKPKEEFGFEGGMVRVWWRDECVGANVEKQRPCMMVEVSETILEEDGLMLPQYSDSNAVSYVLQGNVTCRSILLKSTNCFFLLQVFIVSCWCPLKRNYMIGFNPFLFVDLF